MFFWLNIKRVCLIFFLSISMAACVSQSSVPMKATFTSENSQAIALSPFYLVTQETDDDHAWYLTLKAAEKKPVAGFLKPNQLLIHSVMTSLRKLPLQSDQRYTSSGCRGQFSLRIGSVADKALTGNIEFTDYSMDCTLSLGGNVALNVSDTSASQIITTINAADLIAKTADNQYQVTGILDVTFNLLSAETNYSASSNLSMIASKNERYDLYNLQIEQSKQQEYLQLSLNGRIDFSHYGTVEITTNSPLLIQKETGQAFDGMLTFHGANNSWVRIFFPKAAYPGFFRLDGSDGLQTMGKL